MDLQFEGESSEALNRVWPTNLNYEFLQGKNHIEYVFVFPLTYGKVLQWEGVQTWLLADEKTTI
jgi:hypothetical protein